MLPLAPGTDPDDMDLAALDPDVRPAARMKMNEVLGKPAPKPEQTPKPDQARAVAHLMDGVLTNLGHVTRHLDSCRGCLRDPDRMKFNLDHLEDHLAESVDHARRLMAALAAYHPAIADELDKLHLVTQPGQALPSPARSAGDGNYEIVFPRPGAPEPE